MSNESLKLIIIDRMKDLLVLVIEEEDIKILMDILNTLTKFGKEGKD